LADALAADLEALCRRVRRLRLRVLRKVTAGFGGSYASAFRGPGMEFAELRHYQPGDDVRRIDWQVTARRREPYVRRYVEERELRVLIAMDVSASMGRPGEGSRKREAACQAAAALALSAARSGDRVGGLLFGSTLVSTMPLRRGERHALDVVRMTLSEGDAGARTDLRPALSRLRNLHGRAVVFLLTDFLTEPPAWDAGVRRLLAACGRKHDLLAICLRDPAAGALPEDALLEVRDAESARRLVLDTFGTRGKSAGSFQEAHARRTAQTLSACGIPFVNLAPEDDCVGRLLELFRARGRRR